MQHPSAVRSIETVGRCFHLLRRQAPVGEGAEGAGGLVGEDAGAASYLYGRDRGPYGIFHGCYFFYRKNKITKTRERGDRNRSFGEAKDEGAGGELAIFVPAEKREDGFVGGARPALGEAPVEGERGLGA